MGLPQRREGLVCEKCVLFISVILGSVPGPDRVALCSSHSLPGPDLELRFVRPHTQDFDSESLE